MQSFQNIALRLVSLTLLMVAGANLANACSFPSTVNWTGNVNSDWNNSANYDAVPASNDNIVVDPSNFTGAAASPVISSASSYNPRILTVQNGASLTISSTLSTNNRIEVTGSGSKISHTAGTVSVNGATRDLDVSSSGEYEISGGTIDVRDVTVQNGTAVFDLNGGTVNVNRDISVNGTVTIAGSGLTGVGTNTLTHSGGAIRFENTTTFPSTFETVSLSGGMVHYEGTSQTVANASISAFTYNNLSLEGSGTKSMAGNLDVNGDLTISGSAVLDATASNYALNLAGDWDNQVGTAGFDARNAEVIFDGSSAQLLDGNSNFYSLTSSNASGVTINTGADTVSSVLTVSTGTLTTNDSLVFRSTASESARLAELPSGADLSGDIVVQRYLNIGSNNWRMLASPVAGATFSDWDDDLLTTGISGSDVTATTFESISYYDETATGTRDNGFYAPASIGSSIVVGMGYYTYMGNEAEMLDITGPANKGVINLNVSFTDDPGQADTEDGWNLVANPYPGTIDWDAGTGWTKTNVDNACYIWNPAAGQFATYISGVGTNGGSRYITHSQAFWVKTNAASPALIVDEPVKVTNDSTFFKSSQAADEALLVLKLMGNGLQDETVIHFADGASTAFESDKDAWKLPSYVDHAPYLSSLDVDGNDLSINAMPALSESVVVELRPLTQVQGGSSFTIELASNTSIPETACLMLEDVFTGTFTNLHAGNYSFFHSDTAQVARFRLHIGAPVLHQTTHIGCNGATEGSIELQLAGVGPWMYDMQDAMGNSISNGMVATPQLEVDALDAGTYLFEVQDLNDNTACAIQSHQLVVMDNYMLEVSSTVAQASCAGMDDASIQLGIVGGNAPFSFQWTNGATNQQLGGLSPGDYGVSVTDAEGCEVFHGVSVVEPEPVQSAFDAPSFTLYLSDGGEFAPSNASTGATEFEWLFGNGDISNQQNPTYFYTEEGEYIVQLIASNGTCTEESAQLVTVLAQPLAIDADVSSVDAVALIQNGARQGLQFDLLQAQQVSISLFDQAGRLVQSPEQQLVQHQFVELPISELATGIYMLQVSGAEMLYSFKLIQD